MSGDLLLPILTSMAAGATPLVLAALGELISERAGMLNLGVEGMMSVGAIAAFIVVAETGSLAAGFAVGTVAGIAMAMVFAVLTLTFQANQVATGLALALFGAGLSAFVGRGYAGQPIAGLKAMSIPLLSDLPLLGPLLFRMDVVVYSTIFLIVAASWFIQRSRWGLLLRAIGESPSAAHASGYPVGLVRYAAVVFGGATAGLAGAYLSTALAPMWVEGMSAGRGWIALALVVFGTWKPVRVALGAYLFGGMTNLQMQAQALGVAVPAEFLSMLPYAATMVVLVAICRNSRTILLNQPVSLGKSFHPDA
jgi:ABC-type uncharacterized transport system permease subunit